ncbi:MAG: hypothetical protein V7K40_02555 [Nostoc sp.]
MFDITHSLIACLASVILWGQVEAKQFWIMELSIAQRKACGMASLLYK